MTLRAALPTHPPKPTQVNQQNRPLRFHGSRYVSHVLFRLILSTTEGPVFNYVRQQTSLRGIFVPRNAATQRQSLKVVLSQQ